MRVVFVGRDRVVWKRLLWSVLSLGVTRRVWLHRILKEIDGHEARGIDHRKTAAALWAAAVFPVWALVGLSAGLPAALTWGGAALFLVPTTVLVHRTAAWTASMLSHSGIPYGKPGWVWAATLVPVAGNLWFLGWQQSRLNRFWKEERRHPEHGVEVDIPLEDDPQFVVELAQAQKASYFAASRFERKARIRPAIERRRKELEAVRAERILVREKGGSTPVLPWRRPKRPAIRVLDVACNTCQAKFQVRQDPLVETTILCPGCGRVEVIPALGQDALRKPQRRAVSHLKAKCPSCAKEFHALRPEEGGELRCPHCGKAEPFVTAQLVKAKARKA